MVTGVQRRSCGYAGLQECKEAAGNMVTTVKEVAADMHGYRSAKRQLLIWL